MEDLNAPLISVHDNIISIKVPVKIRRRGLRKVIMLPSHRDGISPQRRPDETLVKALARGWMWQKMLDEGKCQSLDHLARQNKINPSYVSRIMRLNLLAPDIKKAILDGTQPRGMNLQEMLKPFPDPWEDQRQFFGF